MIEIRFCVTTHGREWALQCEHAQLMQSIKPQSQVNAAEWMTLNPVPELESMTFRKLSDGIWLLGWSS